MYQTQKQRAHRPASQDVGKNLVSNNLHVNQPTCNLAAVNRASEAHQAQSSNQQHGSGSVHPQANKMSDFAKHNQPGRQNNTSSGSRNVVGGAPQQQAHSMTRDLGAMGLLTQVKKGDDVRTQKKAGGGHGHPRNNAAAQQSAGSAQVNMATKQAPKLNLNMNNQQLANQQMLALLKPQAEAMRGRKTLLLDVDETLVHSTFTPTDQADIILPIDIEGRTCNIYVQVRPKCCEFIVEVGKYYEVVIFTASLSKYAIPLMDMLDPERVAPQRLFREHCTFFNGQFVKDMQRVGRKMEDIIIIDNSPNSYQFQPENGLPILSWYDDPEDDELMRFVPGLRLLAQVDDVRPVILQSVFENEWNIDLSIKICESLLILKYKKQRQEEQERQQKEQQQQQQLQVQQQQQQQQQMMVMEQRNNQFTVDETEVGKNQAQANSMGIKKNNFFNNYATQQQQQQQVPNAAQENIATGGGDSTTMMIDEREINAGTFVGGSSNTDQQKQQQMPPEPAKILAQQQQIQSELTSQANQFHQANEQQQQQHHGGHHQPRVGKKEVAFSGSGKKVQPKQARSSSKPKTYEVNQGVVVGNQQQTSQTQRVAINHDGQDLLAKEKHQHSNSHVVQTEEHHTESHIRFIRQTGPKILKDQIPHQINPSQKPQQSHNRQSPKPLTNQPTIQQNYNESSQVAMSGGTSKIAKKVVNSLNPEKLKQYLLNSQSQQKESGDSGAMVSPQQKVASSRNTNADGGHLTGSHRNLHTVGHLMIKQSSLQARNMTHDLNHNDSEHGSSHHRKNANVTFTTGATTSKTLGLVSGTLTAASHKQATGATSQNAANGSEVRQSIKNGSKRRANSNHTTTNDKKVNLDKFLSVVQQRSNYTPSNQTQGRIAPFAHHYKPSNNDDKKSYNNSNLTMNQSRNIERKKITQMRLGHNATDMVFAQKKLSLKVDREHVNKTSGARGIQLNQNDIVFSKTMNLSQFLNSQTKSVSNTNGNQTTTNQQTQSVVSVPLSKNRATADVATSSRQAAMSHKRQKSGNNNSQQNNWNQSSNVQSLGSLQSKPNPYMSSGNSNTIQQLIQSGSSAANQTSKYSAAAANTKHNGSHQSIRANSSQNNSQQIAQKRMSAGNIHMNNKNMHVSSSINSRQQQLNGGRLKSGGSKKINQSSSVQPSDRDNATKMQAFQEEGGNQQFISGGQSKAHSLTRSNRDYQRSPGKIFNGNNLTGAQALIAASGQAAKNNSNKAINFVKQQQQNQLAGKRQSKPQLMSELTLSLKNKKNNQGMSNQQITSSRGGANETGTANNYSNLIKPLISGRNVGAGGPQTVKHTPNQLDNFSGRSYTQRVGAANAAQNSGSSAVSNFAAGSASLRQHHHHHKGPATQNQRSAAGMATAQATGANGDQDQQQFDNQGNKITPRKKIIKLVSGQTAATTTTTQATKAHSGSGMQGSTTITTIAQNNAAAKKNPQSGLDANQSSLLNNYYQSYQKQMQENNGSADMVGGQPKATQLHDSKQRQQVLNTLNDNQQFNKEQLKTYSLPNNANQAASAANNASAKMENLAQISSKKPHSKTRYQTHD